MRVPQKKEILVDVGCGDALRHDIAGVLGDVRLVTVDVHAAVNSIPAAPSGVPLIVVGLRDKNGRPSTSLTEALRRVAPHTGVILLASKFEDLQPWLARFAKAGGDEAHALELNTDRRAFLDAVYGRLSAPPPEEPLCSLWRQWAALAVRTEAMFCVRNGFRSDLVGSAHRWFTVGEKTLRVKLPRASLPTPNVLGRLGRQLYVGELESRQPWSKSQLAAHFGRSTAAQLAADRRRLRRAVQAWPILHDLVR